LEDRGYECEYLFTGRDCNQLHEGTHHDIFRRINDKSNFGLQENGKHRKLTSHQLRRCFGTFLLRARMDKDKIDFMLGHEDTRTRSAYFKEDPEFLKEEYMKAMQAVSLEKIKVRYLTDKRLLELEEKYEAREAENQAKFKEKDSEIAELKARLVEVERSSKTVSDYDETPKPG
jgi:hypothetical protein